MTLDKARRKWMSCSTGTLRHIGNFKIEADRHALATYALTGQVLDADVGSVAMFSLPDGYSGQLMPGHSMFHSMDLHMLKAARDTTPDIVAAVAHHFRQVRSSWIHVAV